MTEPRGLERGVELTVLDQFDGLRIGQVFDFAHVLVAKPRGFEDSSGIQLRERALENQALSLVHISETFTEVTKILRPRC